MIRSRTACQIAPARGPAARCTTCSTGWLCAEPRAAEDAPGVDWVCLACGERYDWPAGGAPVLWRTRERRVDLAALREQERLAGRHPQRRAATGR
jgi:hypothetical protein